MHRQNWIKHLALLAAFITTPLVAHEYAPGLHQWKVRDGTLILVSGLITNGMSLYAHNYSFYFQKQGEETWYQIPLLEKSKPGDYELNITTKAKDERMVRDARLEIRSHDVFLLRARSAREDDLIESPVTVMKYHLIKSDGDDWPYRFEQVSAKTYPAMKDAGVDAVLRLDAKQLK